MDIILDKLSSDDPLFTHLDLSDLDVNTEQLNEIAEKLDKNTFVVSVSWKTEYGYDINLKSKIEDRVKRNRTNFQRHPSDYVHALLSKHVYTNFTEGEIVKFSSNVKGGNIDTWNDELENWKVFKINNLPKAGRYFSAVYLNEHKKQVVLAHRGTTLEFWDLFRRESPVKTDLEGILGGKIVKQQKEAFGATKEVVQFANNKGYNLSFTGHSLGAWLAELSLYFAWKNFEYSQGKAVTFDSPGSALSIENMKSNVENSETSWTVRQLNMTTYLSAPNFVNCCNSHIGNVYRIYPKITWADNTDWLGASLKDKLILKNFKPILMGLLSIVGHSMTPLVNTFNAVSGKPEKFEKVLDWPRFQYDPSKTNTNIGNALYKCLNSIPILKYLRGLRTIYDAFSKPTFMTLLEIVDQFISGNIHSQQFWRVYEYFKWNASEGYPVIDTVLFDSEEQFNLLYEGHYCTREFNPCKDCYNPDSNDWYLHQLFELSVKKIDKKEIKVSLKQALKNLKAKFTFVFENNRKYICVKSSDIQVDDLREEIVNLCDRYSEIKEILNNKYAYSPQNIPSSQSILISSNIPLCTETLLKRSGVLEEIDSVLKDHKFLVIRGFGGVGKSTIALDYARKVKKDGSSQIVRFIAANSSAKINIHYRDIAETNPRRVIQNQNAKEIIQLVHNSIREQNCSALFIFDNVKRSEDVKVYFDELSNLERSKVIVTTRKKYLSDKFRFKCIQLGPFTKNEAELVLDKNFTKNRFQPLEVNDLIKSFGGEGFVLPFSLSQAVTFFHENPMLSVESYIRDLKESKDKTGTFLLFKSLEKSPESLHVLQYAAYLDPDFISIDIFKGLLNLKEKELQTLIFNLEDLSLINLNRQENGHLGLKLHRLIQDQVKKYANANKHSKIIINEQDILERIVHVLNSLFPNVGGVPNADWQMSQILSPHVERILENNILVIQQDTISELNSKLGNYFCTVACEFSRAVKYHKQALALRKNSYDDQGNNQDALQRQQLKYPRLIHPKIAASLNDLGIVYLKLGKITKALKYYEYSLDMRRALYSGIPHPEIAESLHNLGLAHGALGHMAESLSYHEYALGMRQEFYRDQKHPDIALTLNDIGIIYGRLGDTSKALQYYEDSFKMRLAMYSGKNHPDVAESLNNLGVVYETLRDTAKALEYHEAALKMKKSIYMGRMHPDIAFSLNNIGAVYKTQGDMAKALKYYEAALKMRRELYPGLKHPEIAESLNSLGYVYGKLGDISKELKYYKDSLDMRRAVYPGQIHPDFALCMNNIGVAYESLQDDANSLKYHQQALNMRRELYSEQIHPDIAVSLNNLGVAHGKLGNLEKELKCHTDAFQMRQALYPAQPHPDIAASLNYLGNVYLKLGDPETALKLNEDALEMRRNLYDGQIHPDIATSLNNLGVMYTILGITGKALKYIRDALEMRQTLYPGQVHADIATSLHDLGILYSELGETAGALKYHEKALEMRRVLYSGHDHPDIAESLNNISLIRQKLEDSSKRSLFRNYF